MGLLISAATTFLLLLALNLTRPALAQTGQRAFHFPSDNPAFANQLEWEYGQHPKNNRGLISQPSGRPYRLHCFALTRTARQFFDQARFDPNEPKATPAVYRYLVHAVLASGRRRARPESEKLVIPGYPDLHAFSRDQEELLKSEMGGAWQSFLQRGNWRMVFPFSGRHQERTARELVRGLQEGEPPLVHLVCFPSLTLNHFVLVFDSKETQDGLEFTAYDPNDPSQALVLFYRSGSRRFSLAPNRYFRGGPVQVYQVYCGMLY